MPIKIAVFNRKGGVGKTTLSIILTQIALMNNKRVVAVDQDDQCNLFKSLEYLPKEERFKNSFTLRTDLQADVFNIPTDFLIIDCPPNFSERTKLALKKADFILIPVRPDFYSTLPFSRIRDADESKKLFQFPLVKIGFVEGSIHDKSKAAKLANLRITQLLDRGYRLIGDLPLYDSITANISSDLKKWWSVGLQASAREHFEFVYNKIGLLYKELCEHRKNDDEWHGSDYDYYDDPENPDLPSNKK